MHKLNIFRSAIKFVRPKILITCYAIIFVGSAAAGRITLKTVLALLVLIPWYVHAATTNDYADRAIDEINLPKAKDRPLVTKELTASQVWVIHAVGGVLALLGSWFYGWAAVLLTVGLLIIDYIYSLRPIRLSDRGIFSQLVLAAAYVYFPVTLGFLAAANNAPYPWLLSAGLYFGFVGRLFLKDFRDVRGDKRFGKLTFLIRHGAKTTCTASALAWSIAILLIVMAVHLSLGVILPLSLGLMIVLGLLTRLARVDQSQVQQKIIRVIARAANLSILTVLAYFLCLDLGLTAMATVLIPALVGTFFMFVISRQAYLVATS